MSFSLPTQPTVEILSQGDEVLSGQVVDTNAAWLAEELTQLGCRIKRHGTVGDCLDDIIARLIAMAAEPVDLCLCTGGLGPTTDDLTAEAVSRAFGLPLKLDPVALEAITARMTQGGRSMAGFNSKQAYLPEGAERLDNLWGTAPGFMVCHQACRFIFLPGVPREMRSMFEQWVKPGLKTLYPLKPERRAVFRTVGVGESTLQERMNALSLPEGVRLGFWARETEVQVKLAFADSVAESLYTRVIDATREALEPWTYGMESESGTSGGLPEIIRRRLREQNQTLLVLDAASHGNIALDLAGESHLLGSVVARDVLHLARLLNYRAGEGGQDELERLATWAREQHEADCVLLAVWQESAAPGQRNAFCVLRCVIATKDTLWVQDYPLTERYRGHASSLAALALDGLRRRLIAS